VNERDWLVPSLLLTLVSGSFGIVMIPDYSGILPALGILPLWMLAAAILGSVYGFFAMAAARVESPLARTRAYFLVEWRKPVFLTFCLLLAGVNMTTFMWVKPLLNYLVPFWADPALADLDRALFLGRDPWTLFGWLNSTPMAIFYHRGWFAMMVLTLIVILAAPPSPAKSAMMLTYFALWSVVGPVVHALLPAAGPVFYAQLGYGDRFAALETAPETTEMASYLWAVYAGEGFGPGSGISAMPSLHIATTAWMIVAVYIFARRWLIPVAAAGLLIFLLSISLGWHYALDGLAGAAATCLCYRLFSFVFAERLRRQPSAAFAA
jgi:hypothetical protein